MLPKINVVLDPLKVAVQQGFPQINVEYNPPQIIVIGTNNMSNIVPFSVTATSNGQTVFTLLGPNGQPITFKTVICFFIMGTGQNILGGDYTINGSTVTLGTTAPIIEIGDIIYGAGQV